MIYVILLKDEGSTAQTKFALPQNTLLFLTHEFLLMKSKEKKMGSKNKSQGT
jgi:hypothetical protein